MASDTAVMLKCGNYSFFLDTSRDREREEETLFITFAYLSNSAFVRKHSLSLRVTSI